MLALKYARALALLPLAAGLLIAPAMGSEPSAGTNPPKWARGLPNRPDYFPIGVWLQAPRNAARFKAAGINLYVALWQGPTEEQLAELKAADMPVICAQNKSALALIADPTIVGWMHDDEPDNAQSLGEGKGYGPPVPPARIVADYQRMHDADPTRPVMLNLGQAVAWDNWIGRGVRSRHPEDYPEYVQGCDLASFDIYPAVHDNPEVAGKLEFVAQGVKRLVGWTGGAKPVWACIECTHISNPDAKPTPDQVRSEVWMAIIHGARGLVYFVHEFKPQFKEAGLLDDPPMLEAVTQINRQIRELAPVINGPDHNAGVRVTSSVEPASISFLARQHEHRLYLFAVNTSNKATHGVFRLSAPSSPKLDVLSENRILAPHENGFEDDFAPYEVHLYRGQ